MTSAITVYKQWAKSQSMHIIIIMVIDYTTAVGVVGGRLSENGGVRTVDQPRSGQLPQEVEA